MSGSRSIAAARARRGGEVPPPISGNRPVTSIGSHAAFAPPPQYQQSNVRIARAPQPPQQQYQQQQQQQPQNTNGLPFSKLSISDAIGLITLRLGRVEQFMIELDHNEELNANASPNIPDNSKIIDTSVLTTIINRLDSLEKREPIVSNTTPSVNLDDFNKLLEDVKNLNNEVIKHNLTIAKHTEQMFRVERDTVETRDMLKTLMLKFDMFVNESNARFGDYEYALGELEKNIPVLPVTEENTSTILTEETANQENSTDLDDSVPKMDSASLMSIMSVDLKSIIQQELANEM
jgi:hypothetical protein